LTRVPEKTDVTDHEAMVRALEATGNYRILRRLSNRRVFADRDGSPTRIGIFIDLETTGLDPTRDEIIEFGMVPFTYALDGRIFDIGDPFGRLRQPSGPIPPEITALTGITDAMVLGESVDPGEIEEIVAAVALIVAHNAAFDRRFAERFCSAFITKPWACSMSEVPWAEEGFDGAKLTYLLSRCGLFFEGHRAVDDCRAAIELLSRPLPKSGVPALSKLLDAARKPTLRIWAENSPFDLKDVLKSRGYRWNADPKGKPRCWYYDAEEESLEDEIHYLRSEIFRSNVQLRIDHITAFDRYSERG
jgi:DNA polymerase III subunit epsilon